MSAGSLYRVVHVKERLCVIISLPVIVYLALFVINMLKKLLSANTLG